MQATSSLAPKPGRTKLPPWPYPAPGKFAEWKFEPFGKAGSWWVCMPRDNPHGRGVTLTGSIRRNIFRLEIFPDRRDYRSLKLVEAAFVAYLLTGELSPP